MNLARQELAAAQKLAEAALVSREADEFARGALQRLAKLFGNRERALGRLHEALAALGSTADEALLEGRLAKELTDAIASAERANVDQAEIRAAKAALNKSVSGAVLMAELKACKDALEFAVKFTSDGTWAPRLQAAVDVLQPAVEKARTYDVEPRRLAEAEEVLSEALKLLERHGKALGELLQWIGETKTAHRRVNDGQCKAKEKWGISPSLKACVAELDDAIERGEKARVDDALLDKAKRVLVPARSTARFGKSLAVVETFDPEDELDA